MRADLSGGAPCQCGSPADVCPVYLAAVDGQPSGAAPAEVQEARWTACTRLLAELEEAPEQLPPCYRMQADQPEPRAAVQRSHV